MAGALTPVQELTEAQLADEYAETRLRMMAWRPEVNPDAQRFGDLGDELLRRQEDKPADQQIIVDGAVYRVPISPRENRTSIVDPLAVYRIVRREGVGAVLRAYTITLAKIRKVLSEAQQEKCLKTERTGPREIREPVLKGIRP